MPGNNNLNTLNTLWICMLKPEFVFSSSEPKEELFLQCIFLTTPKYQTYSFVIVHFSVIIVSIS